MLIVRELLPTSLKRGFILFFIFLLFFTIQPLQAAIDSEPFIERLYTNIFEREADEDGLAYWESEFNNGKTTTDVANYFFTSEEFNDLNLSDIVFLTRTYTTLLNREPDSSGFAYWLDQILNKGMMRDQMFYSFALSNEFKEISESYGIESYSEYNQLMAFINRFYNLVLQRKADPQGLESWTNALTGKEKTANDIAKEFFLSKEFLDKNVDDETFIKILYRALMNREADETGITYWKDELKKTTREKVLEGFLASQEFKNICGQFLNEEREDTHGPNIYSSSSVNVYENHTGTIIDVKASDSSRPITYGISSGVDQGEFNIDTNSGVLTFKNIPVFENPTDSDINNVYEVEVAATDGVNNSSMQMIQITVKRACVVLKTGQTISHYANDDGDLQNGIARSYTRVDDIVMDNVTKLQWQDNNDTKTVTKQWLTEANYDAEKYYDTSGDTAATYCENLILGGHNDWRLPNDKELLTIIDRGRNNPAIDPTFKNTASGNYWSSVTDMHYYHYKQSAWIVDFDKGGGAYSRNKAHYDGFVRCVRGKPLGVSSFIRDRWGIVTDNCTKLQWQDDTTVTKRLLIFNDAIDYCATLSLGGYNDWRLPNINELNTIVDRNRFNSAIDPIFQRTERRSCWSSTTVDYSTSHAWAIYFLIGNENRSSKYDTNYLRCVRGGE